MIELEDNLSEDVQEILNAPPSKLMIWGTAGIVMALCLMVFFGWMYEFPEKVVERFYLTTQKPPLSIGAPFQAKVTEYFVDEGDEVIEGDPLLYLEDGAKIEHIDSIQHDVNRIILGTVDITRYHLPKGLRLGEVSPAFKKFEASMLKYENVRNTNETKANLEEIDRIRKNNANEINKLEKKIKQAEDDLILLNKDWQDKADKTLTLPISEQKAWERVVENANQRRKEKRQELTNLKEFLGNAYDEGKQIIAQDLAMGIDAKSDEAQSIQELMLHLDDLQKSLFDWKTKHILKAPISGKVTFYGVPEDKGYFELNQQILSIIPFQEDNQYTAHIKLPVQKLSKIETGDSVLLKFNRYPFLEFGGVMGYISEKLPSHNPDFYQIKVTLPNGLITTLRQELDFQHQMPGQAEIIVDDKRLIERLLEKFLDFVW